MQKSVSLLPRHLLQADAVPNHHHHLFLSDYYISSPCTHGDRCRKSIPVGHAAVECRMTYGFFLGSFSDKQGTNRAFINKGDGKGQSTKGRVQMLADIRGSGAERRHAKNMNYVPLPEAGSMGTNKAFVNKGDGKGLRGTSKLSGFGTDAAFLHKADGSGQSTKGTKQMLYEWTGGKLG